MNSKLAYVVLFSVFTLVTAIAAETAGIAISSVAYAVPFGAFIISFVLLTLGNDYARLLGGLESASQSALLPPAEEVFGSMKRINHRPANRRRTSIPHSRRTVVQN